MNSKRPSHFLDDIQDFIKFLSGLWGLLSGITALFPLSNLLFHAIPVNENNNTLFTVFSTLISVFGILYVFVSRGSNSSNNHSLASESSRVRTIAVLQIIFGVLALFVYLFLFSEYGAHLPQNGLGASQLISVWLTWIATFSAYAATFFLCTLSFTNLALIEYDKQIKIRDYSSLQSSEIAQLLINAHERIEKQAKIIRNLRGERKKEAPSAIFSGAHGKITASVIIQRLSSKISMIKGVSVVKIDVRETDAKGEIGLSHVHEKSNWVDFRVYEPSHLDNYVRNKCTQILVVDEVFPLITVRLSKEIKPSDVSQNIQNVAHHELLDLGLLSTPSVTFVSD